MSESTDARPAKGLLEGVRILDFSRVVAGPLATQILGDMGPRGEGGAAVCSATPASPVGRLGNDPDQRDAGLRRFDRA